ncbi:retrovirus-related pol polyprotein from transposon TNT 1-94 [Tanacetum coccineum]|uniref:Retrovirus-related pol polyprotein from transposon TNT 1-94 n=1 Tax=Tanacetum coccineum TaxID=301880 RepID=A0ABQ5DNV0_9ASTR
MDCETSWKNLCETSWISKMENLENENVSLEFQTGREIDELIENVNQKTYAYGDVRAQNKDLLITISELIAKLKTAKKGKSVNTKFDKPLVFEKLRCVTPINKQVVQKKKFVPKTEEKHVLTKIVTLQTSPNKKKQVVKNTNVMAPGMYKYIPTRYSVDFLRPEKDEAPEMTETPYELLRDRKPNVQYFYVFGSLCYPTNDREDLRKMKPKADIGIFIGYSETSRGFQIDNSRTRKIMETIHIKLDELTAMASEHICLELATNHFNDADSLAEFTSTSSKEDLDNLFGLMYEEYFEKKSPDVSINSAA